MIFNLVDNVSTILGVCYIFSKVINDYNQQQSTVRHVSDVLLTCLLKIYKSIILSIQASRVHTAKYLLFFIAHKNNIIHTS